jgi:hypothetical protein
MDASKSESKFQFLLAAMPSRGFPAFPSLAIQARF